MEEDIFALVIPVYRIEEEEWSRIARILEDFDYSLIIDDSGEPNLELKKHLELTNNCEYLYNAQELGLSETVNIGIRTAIDKGATWILLLNQDNDFDKAILDIYRRYIKERGDTSSIAIISPQYDYDRHHVRVKKGYKSIKYADMTGSLINVSAYKEIGEYDTRFFIDGLDTEWCLRAKRKHFQIIRCNEAIIRHHPGDTKELRVFDHVVFRYGWHSAERYYYQYRAGFLIHHLYHDPLTDLFFLYKFFKSILLFDKKRDYLFAFSLALRDYNQGFFGRLKLESNMERM